MDTLFYGALAANREEMLNMIGDTGTVHQKMRQVPRAVPIFSLIIQSIWATSLGRWITD